MTDGTSTWTGPYGHIREVIGNARSGILERAKGDYALGYIEALDLIENEINYIESENKIGEYSDDIDINE